MEKSIRERFEDEMEEKNIDEEEGNKEEGCVITITDPNEDPLKEKYTISGQTVLALEWFCHRIDALADIAGAPHIPPRIKEESYGMFKTLRKIRAEETSEQNVDFKELVEENVNGAIENLSVIGVFLEAKDQGWIGEIRYGSGVNAIRNLIDTTGSRLNDILEEL